MGENLQSLGKRSNGTLFFILLICQITLSDWSFVTSIKSFFTTLVKLTAIRIVGGNLLTTTSRGTKKEKFQKQYPDFYVTVRRGAQDLTSVTR